MSNIRLNRFAQLQYGDPRGFLVKLRKLEIEVSGTSLPEPIRTLRTQKLKPEREKRDAAIFCVGISERIGCEVRFAPIEDQDFDFVATWLDANAKWHFCPVQLKEVVPPHLNPGAPIQAALDGLSRYADSADLTVVIKLNRPARFDPAALNLPANLKIGRLWIFGSLSEDQSEWALWGDFLDKTGTPLGTRFSYPSEASKLD
jgi:hypothetical protein